MEDQNFRLEPVGDKNDGSRKNAPIGAKDRSGHIDRMYGIVNKFMSLHCYLLLFISLFETQKHCLLIYFC